jgi:hypothetical protein
LLINFIGAALIGGVGGFAIGYRPFRITLEPAGNWGWPPTVCGQMGGSNAHPLSSDGNDLAALRKALDKAPRLKRLIAKLVKE